MAAVIVPTIPHTPQIRQTFPARVSNSKPSQRQRISVFRAARPPLGRRTLRKSEQSLSTRNDWSFEQRMQEALNVLELMEAQGLEPDPSLFCILLKSCASEANLEFGKTIHSKIVGSHLEADVFVANNLINMYAKCGCFETARQLFEKMSLRNAVSWTAIISMYSQSGFHDEALRLYKLMKLDRRVEPNAFTYTIALNSCAKVRNLELGIEIHEDIARNGCETDDFIMTALIDMYVNCGRIHDARRVFDKMDEPTVAVCTAMLNGYSSNKQAEEAMALIQRILLSALDINMVDELGFTSIFRSCVMTKSLRQGQEIHAHMVKFGHKPGVQAINALVIFYEECDKMMFAHHLFKQLQVKDLKLWERMILGFVRNGMNKEAQVLYFEMVREGVELNSNVLSSALNACVGVLGLKEGKEIHGRVIKTRYALAEDAVVASLEKLYGECGQHEDILKVMK